MFYSNALKEEDIIKPSQESTATEGVGELKEVLEPPSSRQGKRTGSVKSKEDLSSSRRKSVMKQASKHPKPPSSPSTRMLSPTHEDRSRSV